MPGSDDKSTEMKLYFKTFCLYGLILDGTFSLALYALSE